VNTPTTALVADHRPTQQLWRTETYTTHIQVREVDCIRDVGCAHPGFATFLARIGCPKVFCVHPSKWPLWLRALVPQKTLSCICFRNDSCQCVHQFSSHQNLIFGSKHPKIWFLLPGFYHFLTQTTLEKARQRGSELKRKVVGEEATTAGPAFMPRKEISRITRILLKRANEKRGSWDNYY